MYCRNCKKRFDSNVSFCKYCGARLVPVIDEEDPTDIIGDPISRPINSTPVSNQPVINRQEDNNYVVNQPIYRDTNNNKSEKKSGSSKGLVVVIVAVFVILVGAVLTFVFFGDDIKDIISGNDTSQSEDENEQTSEKENKTRRKKSEQTNQNEEAETALPTALEVTTYAVTTMPPITTAPPTYEIYRVITEGGKLNMRTGPGTEYEMITQIPKDSYVNVISIAGEWAYIEYNGSNGYVCIDYLTK